MRAYHEVGDNVQVKQWPIGTPPVLMYTTGHVFPRDLALSVREVLSLADELGKDQVIKYLYALQQMLDRTNGVRHDIVNCGGHDV